MIFLDTAIYKGKNFKNEHTPHITFFIQTFQFLHRASSHPNSVFKTFIKGEILRYKKNTNSIKNSKDQNTTFENRLNNRKYPNYEIYQFNYSRNTEH